MRKVDDRAALAAVVEVLRENCERRRMNSFDADAVAHYLKEGGQVDRIRETVSASDQEIIEYLASCGHHARYCDGDARPYICDKKRYGAVALVRLANSYRLARGLAPFALTGGCWPIRQKRD
jgi:hypothetical protein